MWYVYFLQLSNDDIIRRVDERSPAPSRVASTGSRGFDQGPLAGRLKSYVAILTEEKGRALDTVRGLAQVLKVSKPAITRALERLGALDLVRRRTDEADRRGGYWREFFNRLSQEQTSENILQLTVQVFANRA